jgi:hypothetical protein
MTSPPCPIIDPQYPGRQRGRCDTRSLQCRSQQRVGADRDRKPSREARSSRAPKREREMLLQIPKSPSSSARKCHHTWQALGKGLARTHLIGTAETASCNFNLHRPSLPRKITQDTPIDAVEAPRRDAAGWTVGGGRTGCCLDGDFVGRWQHPGYLERTRDKGKQL